MTPLGSDISWVNSVIDYLSGHINDSLSIFNGTRTPLTWTLIILAVISGIGAGAIASIRARYIPNWANDSRRLLVTAGATALFLTWFTQYKVTWTNHGVPERIAAQGQIILQSGYARFGLGLGSFLVFTVFLMTLSLLFVKYVRDIIGNGMPIIRNVFAKNYENLDEFNPRGRVVGRVISTSLILWILIPIGGSIFERQWAVMDGPDKVVAAGMRAFESGDPEKIASEYNFVYNKQIWLTKPILVRALRDWMPGNSETNLSVLKSNSTLDNSNGKTWQLGQLDVVSNQSWIKNAATSKSSFELNGKVEDRYKVLRHAVYKWSADPFTVEIKLGPFYPKNLTNKITLNGEKIKPGKYFAVPGFYTISAPGAGIIDKTDGTLAADGHSLVIEVGTKGSLPSFVNRRVAKLLDEKKRICAKISKDLTSECSSAFATNAEMIPGSESVPSWDSYTYANIKTKSYTCTDSTSKVTSTNSVITTKKCTQEIAFTVNWVKDAITEPITRDVDKDVYVIDGYRDGSNCIDYDSYLDYCYEYEQVPYGHYETQTTTVTVGTRTIEPRHIYKREYTSSVDFWLSAIATKGKNNAFTVKAN